MKSLLFHLARLASIAALALLPAAGAAHADPPAAVYEVTITNLTHGQWFTPPLLATHRRPLHVFEVGAPASFELKEIAENGNLAPMIAALSADRHVSEVVVAVAGDPPPLGPGASVTVQISAERGAKFLSMAAMLICTNDGFTGLDRVRLPKRVGRSAHFYADGYDAGTEINTEDFADLVPPCPALTGVPTTDPGTGASNPALAEGGVIHHHGGILGGNDLVPAIHGWANPVAQIVVTRLR